MIKFLHADEFMAVVLEHRVLYFAGEKGSGKSSVMAAMSYLLLRLGKAKHCVATMPLAWAMPADMCPSANYIACLDELGTKLDARSFAEKGQNEMRVSALAFPRKLNVFILLASVIVPDASFRALTVQRTMRFWPFLPLEIFYYGFDYGKQQKAGWFAVWDRGWLWRVDKNNPSPKYGSEYVLSSVEPVFSLFRRSIADAQGIEEPNFVGDEEDRQEFARWLGVEYGPSADHVPDSDNGQNGGDQSGQSDTTETGQGRVFNGRVSATNRAGGITFPT